MLLLSEGMSAWKGNIKICAGIWMQCKSFARMKDGLKRKIGNPDLLVLFTNTTCHKMVRCALDGTKGKETVIASPHSSSMAALKRF